MVPTITCLPDPKTAPKPSKPAIQYSRISNLTRPDPLRSSLPKLVTYYIDGCNALTEAHAGKGENANEWGMSGVSMNSRGEGCPMFS